MANMFVQWFDVDPTEVYLLAGMFSGIVRTVFSNGFKHPALIKTVFEDVDDSDVTLIFKRKRPFSATTTTPPATSPQKAVVCTVDDSDEDDEDVTLVFKRNRP